MNKLTQALMEELTVEYVKVGPLQIPESVVISWVMTTSASVRLCWKWPTLRAKISLKACWARRAHVMCPI